MRARWIIVAIAGFVAAAAWAAVAFTYFYLNPSIALFTAVATVAALSLEGCFVRAHWSARPRSLVFDTLRAVILP